MLPDKSTIVETDYVDDEGDRDPSLLFPNANLGVATETLIDCAVCLYWSERLETSRSHQLSVPGAEAEEKRLIATLKEHQSQGACARRLPSLFSLLKP